MNRFSVRDISVTTMTMAVFGFVGSAVLTTVSTVAPSMGVRSEDFALIAQPSVELLAAIVVLFAATTMIAGRDRRMWHLVGLGVMGAAMGDALWAIYTLVLHRDIPYPGPADGLYVLEYVTFTYALLTRALRDRDGRDLTWQWAEAFIGTGVIAVGVWLVAIHPVLRAGRVSVANMMDVGYVALDLVAMILPALFMIFSRWADRRQPSLTPWLVFGIGVFIVAGADLGWFVQNATSGWQPGSLVDFAYMVGHLTIALAAMIKRDELRARRATAEKPEPVAA